MLLKKKTAAPDTSAQSGEILVVLFLDLFHGNLETRKILEYNKAVCPMIIPEFFCRNNHPTTAMWTLEQKTVLLNFHICFTVR